jgi:hypothetical protein
VQIDKGPVFTIIPLAATAAELRNGSIAASQNLFHVKQTVYLTFTVQAPPTDGVVTIKWYRSGQLMGNPEQQHIVRGDGQTQSRIVSSLFTAQGQCAVELYWNDRLAQRLYFTVL